MSALAVVAVWVAYLAGWVALRAPLEEPGRETTVRPRTWAVVLWCAVAVPSLVQVAWAPVLLEWGRRESSAVAAGQ